MKKYLFTLVEILISLIIIGILVVLLFKIYVTIGNINIRLENEKILQNEIMFFNYFINQILDKTDFDYSQYTNLQLTKGLTKSLILSGKQYKISIYSTGECNISTWKEIKNKNCWIEANINGKKIALTNSGKVYISNLTFKIIPFEKNPYTFSGTYNPGFGVSFVIYSKKYNPNFWSTNVKINYNDFFNKN